MTSVEIIWWCVAGPILFWWVLLALGSAMQARKFAGLFLREPREAFKTFRPSAVIIVPCKGADPQLADNLAAIMRQDYPAPYRVILVAQAEDDPAVPIIRDAIANAEHDDTAHPAELLISGDAPPNQGQKVWNQVTALKHLGLDRLASAGASALPAPPSALAPDTAIVFADSDAVPGNDWLANLVGPLKQRDKTAVTTGYRWLVPPPKGTPDPHPQVTAIASIMNSSVLSFAGTGKFQFAWGGSMAMLAQTAIDGDLLGMFDGALCDDYQVTRMTHKLGKRVYFVHRCIVDSPDAWSWPGLRDFAYRQYMLTRKYFPGLYLLALTMLWAYPVGFVVSMGSSFVLVPWLIVTDQPWYAIGIPALGSAALVMIFDKTRHHHRKIAMARALPEDIYARLGRVRRKDAGPTLHWMTIHAYLAIRPMFSNVMTWRGITYRLHGPQRCGRIDPPPT
ncbi:MAG: glycosyltransferase family 2 protein [Planctomycetota bacterium]